ncbi:conjugative transfer signal peptidase TraF [Xanthomonas campestris pv. campestris]|uniref:conjugative transfer signal peptidase TraF n=1 Tax=Xanthomonas campestris TaxID=339 RepID=UPI001E55FD89|nr:conjugative transfer signal peptidase TraF [Xanthomonas campestris]MCD0253108.1 conjugative transfer signal peptidase TraF [Xanthomonas campestris pv. campestris]
MMFAKMILIPTGLVIVGIFAGTALGVRLNVTPSVPTGLYLQSAAAPTLLRGRLVVACLDTTNPATVEAIKRQYLPDGDCPGHIAPVLKPIAAIPGDRITTTPAGIAVNGVPMPGTARREKDPEGRPLASPSDDYTLAADQVLLLVNRTSSFDGRYFGPLPAANVRAEARPLLLF